MTVAIPRPPANNTNRSLEHTMKTHTAIIAALAVATSLLADTLQIGAFTLPYRFEDTNITDIVRCVVTNDVQSFCAPITAFRPPYQDKSGNVCVQRINTPGTSFYRPEVFMHGIKFYIENGQTNCVIKQSLTDAAKAIECELPMRTNLVAGARLFVGMMADGSITNRSISELRTLTRVYRNGFLSAVSETDGPDDIIMRNFAYFSRGVAFFPLCVLDAESRPDGTNTCFFVMARYDYPNDPSYARSIGMRPLVYSNGYWSLCF